MNRPPFALGAGPIALGWAVARLLAPAAAHADCLGDRQVVVYNGDVDGLPAEATPVTAMPKAFGPHTVPPDQRLRVAMVFDDDAHASQAILGRAWSPLFGGAAEVEGDLSGGRSLILRVRGADKQELGVVAAEFVDRDPRRPEPSGQGTARQSLGCTAVYGAFHPAKGGPARRVYLRLNYTLSDDVPFAGMDNPREARAALTQAVVSLQAALAADRPAELAARTVYPLTVRLGKRKLVLRRPADFVRHTRALLSPQLRRVVLAEPPQDLFHRHGFWYFGRGELMIDNQGRIAEMNPKLFP